MCRPEEGAFAPEEGPCTTLGPEACGFELISVIGQMGATLSRARKKNNISKEFDQPETLTSDRFQLKSLQELCIEIPFSEGLILKQLDMERNGGLHPFYYILSQGT